MATRIVDIIIALLIIAYIFWKHRDNLDWYSLVIIMSAARIIFDVVVALNGMEIISVSIPRLNMFSRILYWMSTSIVLYYAIRGEKRWS